MNKIIEIDDIKIDLDGTSGEIIRQLHKLCDRYNLHWTLHGNGANILRGDYDFVAQVLFAGIYRVTIIIDLDFIVDNNIRLKVCEHEFSCDSFNLELMTITTESGQSYNMYKDSYIEAKYFKDFKDYDEHCYRNTLVFMFKKGENE